MSPPWGTLLLSVFLFRQFVEVGLQNECGHRVGLPRKHRFWLLTRQNRLKFGYTGRFIGFGTSSCDTPPGGGGGAISKCTPTDRWRQARQPFNGPFSTQRPVWWASGPDRFASPIYSNGHVKYVFHKPAIFAILNRFPFLKVPSPRVGIRNIFHYWSDTFRWLVFEIQPSSLTMRNS